MGQHKRNQTAVLAKQGKLPPKQPPIGAAESRRRVYNQIMQMEPFNTFARHMLETGDRY